MEAAGAGYAFDEKPGDDVFHAGTHRGGVTVEMEQVARSEGHRNGRVVKGEVTCDAVMSHGMDRRRRSVSETQNQGPAAFTRRDARPTPRRDVGENVRWREPCGALEALAVQEVVDSSPGIRLGSRVLTSGRSPSEPTSPAVVEIREADGQGPDEHERQHEGGVQNDGHDEGHRHRSECCHPPERAAGRGRGT